MFNCRTKLEKWVVSLQQIKLYNIFFGVLPIEICSVMSMKLNMLIYVGFSVKKGVPTGTSRGMFVVYYSNYSNMFTLIIEQFIISSVIFGMLNYNHCGNNIKNNQ